MTTILSFLFVLGVLVFVHELGHFLVARWHGVRVITFSLGFGPKILKFQRGDTEYCISIVPLGGYVKLAGETMEETQGGAPDEFMSKSKWVRFQVYLAGPVMNILLAIVVAAAVLSRGANVPTFKKSAPIIGSVAAGSPAELAGLRVGDRIVDIDGEPVSTWDAVDMVVLTKAGRELSLGALREGQTVHIRVTPAPSGDFETGEIGIDPVFRPEFTQINPHSPAAEGGLQPGDVLMAVNGDRGLSHEKTIELIHNSANKPLLLTVERAGTPVDVTVVPRGADGAALIGVVISPYEVERIDPTAVQAVKMSLAQNWEHTVMIGKTIRGLFTRDTPMQQLMGPVGMAQLSGNAAEIGWGALFSLMAMISLNLGLLNLMPVPVLDGGHIAILAVEGIARRDLSARVKEGVLMTGVSLVVLLMVTVIYNDIARILR